MWACLGHKENILKEKWPKPDDKFIKEDKAVLIIQVNGKVRDRIEADMDISREEVENMAKGNEKVKKWLDGKEIREIFFVPNKLINIVTK